jgi:molecular chaperone GrpE (heat shock protein)
MAVSRQDLLDLVEETYGVRHPDFDSIRKQYSRITENIHDEDIESDARLLIAGVDATKNTYEDWSEMSEHERKKALNAIKRIRNLTRSTLKKYDVAVE